LFERILTGSFSRLCELYWGSFIEIMAKVISSVLDSITSLFVPNNNPSTKQQSLGVAATTTTAVLATATAAAIPLYYFCTRRAAKNQAQYPPGPKGVWLLGNALDLPNISNGEPIDTQ
jgi:hypothetical protein